MTPKLGQRYAIHAGKNIQPSVYELIRVEPDGAYQYVMRLISADPQRKRTPGEEMTVELAWFAHRGSLPAGTVGAVREVE
jgi:hypothetical protein